MTLRHIQWQEQGYWLLLLQAKRVTDFPLQPFHLLVSADGKQYAIYDRFQAPSLEAARASIRFNPLLYEAVSPPFPISREQALRGETGIPPFMEPLVQQVEQTPWTGERIGNN